MLHEFRVELSVVFVALIAVVNLRGVREASKAFAIPTYVFAASIAVMVITALVRTALGNPPVAESAGYSVAHVESLTQAGLILLLLRAFASGASALTGVEAIANGVQAFRVPKIRNARTTLLLLGTISVTLFVGLVVTALIAHVHYAQNPCDLSGWAQCATEPQRSLVAQLAAATFGNDSVLFFIVQAATAVVLLLAANTAFNGFPLLTYVLAKDSYAPKALSTRGDRLVFSNGVVGLALAAVVLLLIYQANLSNLIQLYIIGVFVSFTLSQTGMVRHWTRLLRNDLDPAARVKMQTSRVISGFGLTVTALVLVVVMITKFTHGAWISIVAMGALFFIMTVIRRHYDSVAHELAVAPEDRLLPTRVHALVLVSKLHKPTLRALAFAKASRPNTLEGVYVSVDPVETDRLLEEWDQANTGVPLKVLHSPYREVIKPIVEYASAIRRASPRAVVAVYIPEYVVGRWWEQLLHNQTALQLKARLLFTPGVMVTSVPYQLRSSTIALEHEQDEVRRAQGRPL
jgi:amino acid transporter